MYGFTWCVVEAYCVTTSKISLFIVSHPIEQPDDLALREIHVAAVPHVLVDQDQDLAPEEVALGGGDDVGVEAAGERVQAAQGVAQVRAHRGLKEWNLLQNENEADESNRDVLM